MSKGLIKRNGIVKFGQKYHRQKKKIVFTNGVFDIIHRGHVEYLAAAKSLGDVLIIGLNSDASVRRIKGKNRPINNQSDRAAVLLALRAVDNVVIFGEDTPEKLIKQIKPDLLIKGADYKLTEIVGAEFVKACGGEVRRIKLTKGKSSSRIITKLNKS